MTGGPNHAIYLDWENIWLGFLQKAFPQYISKDKPPPPLDPEHRSLIERFPSVLVDAIKSSISSKHDESISPPIDGNCPRVRFIKALSEWSFLPLAQEIQLLALVRSVGIMPHQSHARQFKSAKSTSVIKEASDRALILRVVEDTFLRKVTNFDSIIVGSGDIGFVPLIEFLIEHTSLDVGIISIGSHVLSRDLKYFVEANFGTSSVHILDQEESFRLYYDECKGKIPSKKEAEPMLPNIGTELGSGVVEIKAADEQIDKEKALFIKLIVGLLKTKLPYISRGHFVNRWLREHKRGYLDDVDSDEIVDSMVEKEILVEKESAEGIVVIDLNQNNELVKECKKSILSL